MNFVAIDFETANEQRSSPCSIGLAVVKNGQIQESFAKLIRPAECRFNSRNVDIHGIRPEDVESEPEFPQIWEEVRSYIEEGTLVAHSANFDISVLTSTLMYYQLAKPSFRYLCTVKVAKAVWPSIGSYTLSSVAGMLKYPFRHHDAREDASACAVIATRACFETQSKSLVELTERIGINFCDTATIKTPQKRARRPRERKATEFIPSSLDFDPVHPFFGRIIAFTGPLVSLDRDEAMQYVADVGGQPANSVTKKTDFLVVGGRYFDVFSHKTGKLKRATELIAKGSPLDIIGEDDFLKMLDE